MTFYLDAKEHFGAECADDLIEAIEYAPGGHTDELSACERILESHGVMCHGIEPIKNGDGYMLVEEKQTSFDLEDTDAVVAYYINRGDTYDATLLYDVGEGEIVVTSWGDWYEANMVDQSEKFLKEAIEEELYRLDIDSAMAEAIIAKIKEGTQIDYDYYVKFKARRVKGLIAEILGDFTYISHDEKMDILEGLGGRIVNSHHKSVIFDREPDPRYVFDNFLSDLLD